MVNSAFAAAERTFDSYLLQAMTRAACRDLECCLVPNHWVKMQIRVGGVMHCDARFQAVADRGVDQPKLWPWDLPRR